MDLTKELFGPLLAAASAVFVAVISAVVNYRLSSIQRDLHRELDIIRRNHEVSTTKQKKIDDHNSAISMSMARQITIIQMMRDLIYRILNAPHMAFTCASATEEAKSIAESYIREFDEMVGISDGSSGDEFHSAKHDIHNAYLVIAKCISRKDFTSEISQRERDELILTRDRVGEVQGKLRDARIGTFEKYYGR